MAISKFPSAGLNTGFWNSTHTQARPMTPLLLYFLFLITIALAGYAIFQNFKEHIKKEKQNELAAIADLKIQQITHWLAERRGEAQTFMDSPFFADEFELWLQRGCPDDKSKKKLSKNLASPLRNFPDFGYTSVTLYDEKAKSRLSTTDANMNSQEIEKSVLLNSIGNSQIILTDIFSKKEGSGQIVEIDLVAPLSVRKGSQAHIVGAVVFRLDPSIFLFPLIQHWPTPSSSSENLLVKRGGNDVIFMNELRHIKNIPLAMRLPINQQQLPAAMAAMGQEGLVDGVDYRGVPVVGVLNKVPGTSWSMVSKTDQAEIYAQINELAEWIAGLMLSMTCMGGLVTAFWLRKERKVFQSEIETQALVIQLDNISKHANDVILLLDSSARIVNFNDRAIETYGYSAEELSGLNMSSLRDADARPQFIELFKEIQQAGSLRFETIHIKKDGSKFPVESSVREVYIGSEKFYQSIIRDITERKHIEDELRKQKNFMLQVIDADPNYIFVKDQEGKFILVNQSLAIAYGLTASQMIGKSYDELNLGPEIGATYQATFSQLVERGIDTSFIEAFTYKNGEKHWFLTTKKRLAKNNENWNILGIAVDITQLRNAEIKLSESYKALQQLSLHLESVREDERSKIGLNLHDEMGAVLAVIKMKIAWIATKLPAEQQMLLTETKQIGELVTEATHNLRQIVSQLRPNLLNEAGLEKALNDYINKFQEHTQIECKLTFPKEDFEQNMDQSLTIFRILQESLNNVAKHSQASLVTIILTKLNESLLLEICDNGIGFDLSKQKDKTNGLLGIKERALMVGGIARIDTMIGKGTSISVSFPLV